MSSIPTQALLRKRGRLPWDSLVARMTALVVAVSIVSLGLHLLVVWVMMDALTQDLAFGLGSTVRYEHDMLLREPASSRGALAQRLSSEQHLIAQANPCRERMPSVQPPPLESALSQLRKQVGSAVQVHILEVPGAPLTGVLCFDMTVGEQSWVIEHRPSTPVWAVVSTGLGWLSLLAVAAVLSLVVGVRLVGRPLSQLATHLAKQSGKLQMLPVPKSASAEVRSLVSAFNGLVQANAQAETNKQHMLAGVSHDLRTPLTRLRFRVETQCEPMIADELCADLHALERIVSQFLGYVQGDNHAGQGEPWPLNDVAARVVAAYQHQHMQVSMAPSLVELPQPDLAIQRALTNLIDNALAYGHAPVEVSLIQAGNRVELAVWDHGKGMSTAEFTHCLQPFVRMGDAQRASGHCGLGLAIVKQVADHLGAQLSTQHDEQGRFGIALVFIA